MTAKGPEKLIYLTLGILFLVLGVVGLLIPILPGVLFLGGALYMLSRGSHQFRQFAENDSRLQGLQGKINRMQQVPAVEQIKVTLLMTAGAVVTGTQRVVKGITRLMV